MATQEQSNQVDETEEIAGLLESRAATYGMLARLYRVEVDADTMSELQGMRFPVATGNSKVDEGYRKLYNYLRGAWEDSITELAIDYVRTFIGHGVNGYSAAYPFESVYTNERRLMMQEARAEVLKTMRDSNIKRGSWTEGEDHLALELEFVQRITMRAVEALRSGDEDTAVEELEKQRTFVNEHLLNWVPMLVTDMKKFAKTDFYQGLAVLTEGFLEEDAALLDELLDGVEEGEGE